NFILYIMSLFLFISLLYIILFFFSNRRRHTRSKRDWSSDVCSSDIINVHFVPFTAMQEKIHREVPFGYSMTVMRRMMLKIAEIVASRLGILSLTTGESLGQVASQTMESMHAIDAVTTYPIMRPLITMDKSSIIKIAEEIGTYPISIRPYDDCCTVFVPKAPKTKPKKEKVEQFESNLDLTKELEELLNHIEVINVSDQDVINDPIDDLF